MGGWSSTARRGSSSTGRPISAPKTTFQDASADVLTPAQRRRERWSTNSGTGTDSEVPSGAPGDGAEGAAAARSLPIPLGSDPVVLLADADERVRDGLTTQLARYQVSVAHCGDGAAALLEAGIRKPDVLLASARLPLLDGATVLQLVHRRLAIPVVLGVGPQDGDQVAAALAAGASACIARPYRPRDVAQLLSLTDRDDHTDDQPLVCGPLTLDPAGFRVWVHGALTARLPLREFQLLHLLMQHAEKVVTRDRIRAELWGDGAGRSNTITVHVRRLRERLGDDPHQPEIIQTVRGVGYRLVPPAS